MQDVRNIIGDNLKRLLKEQGKTRKQAAQDLFIPYSTFTEWVNGRKMPRADALEKLALYFGVKKSVLIDNNNEDKTLDCLFYLGLTAEEIEKVVDYAKYIVSQR